MPNTFYPFAGTKIKALPLPSSQFPDSTLNVSTGELIYRGGWFTHIDKDSIKTILVEPGVTEISGELMVTVDGKGGCFSNCNNLTSITIPASVLRIGGYAFYGSKNILGINVEDVNSCVVLGDYCFTGCSSLVEFNTPKGWRCTDVGASAFLGCSALVKFDLPNTCRRIRSSTFFCCSSLHILNLPDNLTRIDSYALHGCTSLSTLKIPESCKYIDNSAFVGMKAMEALAMTKELSVELYCRKRWREKVTDFKVSLFLCYKYLDNIHASLPGTGTGTGNDVGIGKGSVLWVLYEKIESDDVKRKILEYLGYEWMELI